MQLSYKTISSLAANLDDKVYDLTTRFKPSIAYKISNNIAAIEQASVPVIKELKEQFDDSPDGEDIYFAYEEYATSHSTEVDIMTFPAEELGESVTLTMMELLRIMIEEPTE